MLQENIKKFRKERGLTQEELAIRVNVVRQTVSKWEKGQSVPDADLLQKIAEVLEIPVSQLLGEEKELEQNRNEIAEQLSRINEQLAIRNRRSKRIWTVVGAVFAASALILGTTLLLSLVPSDNVVTYTVVDASGEYQIPSDQDGNRLTIEAVDGDGNRFLVEEIEE